MHTASKTRSSLVAALLVALAFALGFAEFVLIGITPDVAAGLGEPLTRIGDIVGYYALACAVATPVVALATARIDRFKLMAVLLVVFNAGNLLTLQMAVPDRQQATEFAQRFQKHPEALYHAVLSVLLDESER